MIQFVVIFPSSFEIKKSNISTSCQSSQLYCQSNKIPQFPEPQFDIFQKPCNRQHCECSKQQDNHICEWSLDLNQLVNAFLMKNKGRPVKNNDLRKYVGLFHYDNRSLKRLLNKLVKKQQIKMEGSMISID